jgi:hypothetical protein
MAGKTVRDHGREIRETIVKSGLAGVGVTVLAVTLCSPAGLAGMIGTSVASGMGGASATNDPYAKLPPFPSLLTQTDISDIRGRLASVAASMEISRAATDDRIEFVHELAEHPGALSVSAPHLVAKSTPASVAPAQPAARTGATAAATVQPSPARKAAPVADVTVTPSINAMLQPISFAGSGPDVSVRGSHLELAALFFGEN